MFSRYWTTVFRDLRKRNQLEFWFNNLGDILQHKQLVVYIPRLSAPSSHQLGKIKDVGTFFSTRQPCLQSKWPTVTEITDVKQRRMFPQLIFCPVDGRMVLRVQGPLAGYEHSNHLSLLPIDLTILQICLARDLK